MQALAITFFLVTHNKFGSSLQIKIIDLPFLICTSVCGLSATRKLLMANVKYGRRARWLNIIEIFLEFKGNPIQKNQDLILRLLLDEKEVLLDFTGDYSIGSVNLDLPQSLSRDDPRR